MLKAVLFDLDGTLLPMDQGVFAKTYFLKLMEYTCPLGYQPDEFMKGMKAGIGAMVGNDGSRTNYEAFWDAFSAVCGDRIRGDQAHIDGFYVEAFDQIRAVCGFDPLAAETVRGLKDQGVRVILATNPIFPAVATQKRIRWAGLEPEDFELYTTYDNMSLCKPNPAYYREILARQGLSADECLMVGNDVAEDMIPAASLGMKVFLMTDCLLNTPNADIHDYPNGSFPELNAYLGELLSEN